MALIDGLNAGDAVTAEQMRTLLGPGVHPLGSQRLEHPIPITSAVVDAEWVTVTAKKVLASVEQRRST